MNGAQWDSATAFADAICASASELRRTCGAAELPAALAALRAHARAESVRFERGPALDAAVTRILAATEAPAPAPLTAGGLGLGSIFAAASSVARFESQDGARGLGLRCGACGSAQERTLDFSCRYCGGRLGG